MKNIARTLFICLLGVLLLHAPVTRGETASGEVWVAIRVADRGTGQSGAEYYGSVDRKDLLAAVSAPVAGSFLKLSHASWLLNGKLSLLSDASYNGVNFDYGNVVYFRVDTILRIVELSDSFAKDHAPKSK